MPFTELRSGPQPAEFNVSDDARVIVEGFNLLGLTAGLDQDELLETAKADLAYLSTAVLDAEPTVFIPKSVITLGDMRQRFDNATPGNKSYPETDVYSPLWTPGVHAAGYKTEELDNLTLGEQKTDVPTHIRLALHGPDSTGEPLLHFLGQPFDKKYADEGQQTQLDSIDEAIADFDAHQYPDFTMSPLNAKSVMFLALMRRIKGETMPMAWGFMRDATLPRKEMVGGSVVGRVGSGGDGLYLYGSYGSADSSVGVGLSVGPKVLES